MSTYIIRGGALPDGVAVFYSLDAVYQCTNQDGALLQAGPGYDGEKVAKLIAAAHGRTGSVRERDAAGKLTNRCRVCGAKVTLRGYRVWSERPFEDDDLGKPYTYRFDNVHTARTTRYVMENERWASSRKQAKQIAREMRDDLAKAAA